MMKVILVLVFMALQAPCNQRTNAQDALPAEETRNVLSDVSSVADQRAPVKSANGEQAEFLPSHPNGESIDNIQPESDMPLSRKVQNLESSQNETNKKIADLEAEQESVKETHLQKLDALRAAEAETHTADQSKIDELQAANQMKIDALQQDQLVADKTFKTQNAKIEALGEQNRALMAQLTSFFDSETAILVNSNSNKGIVLSN